MFAQLDDTIVAISSPAGAGVRGVIRLSGPASFDVLAAILGAVDLEQIKHATGHRRIMGRVRVGGSGTVPAEVYTFRAPSSYTRQDVIEIHTIGSPPVLASLLEQLTGAGARPAEPGEFTARAYFNGAMDLTRVEGVAAIIQARNDSQLRASEALLHGRLSRRSTQLRDQLADLLALIEAEIDFVEEPIDFISREQVMEMAGAIAGELAALLASAPAVERLETLPEVMLVGRPNAGKSTLFNRLTGMDRAIRSATAGTTRDILRAPLHVPGGEVMLSDCAGLTAMRSAEQDQPAELAEAATRRTLASADLILMIVDISDDPARALAGLQSELPRRPTCIVLNKIDRLPPRSRENASANIGSGVSAWPISALRGDGVDGLRDEIGRMLIVETEAHGAELLALSARQRAALRDAQAALLRAMEICRDAAQTADRAELISIEIREAMNALSLLTGEIATEELLGRIFSRFCVGK